MIDTGNNFITQQSKYLTVDDLRFENSQWITPSQHFPQVVTYTVVRSGCDAFIFPAVRRPVVSVCRRGHTLSSLVHKGQDRWLPVRSCDRSC